MHDIIVALHGVVSKELAGCHQPPRIALITEVFANHFQRDEHRKRKEREKEGQEEKSLAVCSFLFLFLFIYIFFNAPTFGSLPSVIKAGIDNFVSLRSTISQCAILAFCACSTVCPFGPGPEWCNVVQCGANGGIDELIRANDGMIKWWNGGMDFFDGAKVEGLV